MNIKFIIPRVEGDNESFEKIFQSNMPNIDSEVYSIFDEKDRKFNIFQKYNKAIEELIKKGIVDDDVFIFCHNDVGILDTEFKNKIETTFKETDVTAIGIVGTAELRDHGCWWQSVPNTLRGHLIQGAKDKRTLEGIHLIKGAIGFFNDVVAVDGLFMAVKAKVFRDTSIRFRSDIFSDNHFYDLSFCLDLLLAGYNLGTIDLLVYHQSQGSPNTAEVWTRERDKFVSYYKGLGLSFPIDKKSIEVFRNKNVPMNKVEPPSNPEIMEFKL